MILFLFVKRYLVPTIRLLIGGNYQFTKCLKSMRTDQYLQFKELDQVVIKQLEISIVHVVPIYQFDG